MHYQNISKTNMFHLPKLITLVKPMSRKEGEIYLKLARNDSIASCMRATL
jgi:hypothetical protein